MTLKDFVVSRFCSSQIKGGQCASVPPVNLLYQTVNVSADQVIRPRRLILCVLSVTLQSWETETHTQPSNWVFISETSLLFRSAL